MCHVIRDYKDVITYINFNFIEKMLGKLKDYPWVMIIVIQSLINRYMNNYKKKNKMPRVKTVEILGNYLWKNTSEMPTLTLKIV